MPFIEDQEVLRVRFLRVHLPGRSAPATHNPARATTTTTTAFSTSVQVVLAQSSDHHVVAIATVGGNAAIAWRRMLTQYTKQLPAPDGRTA